MKDSEKIHRPNNPFGTKGTALYHDNNMEVEKTHEGVISGDFLTALEQEMAQGYALVQADFSGSPLLKRGVKMSSNAPKLHHLCL